MEMSTTSANKKDFEVEFEEYSKQREKHMNDIDTMSTGITCPTTFSENCTFGGCTHLGC